MNRPGGSAEGLTGPVGPGCRRPPGETHALQTMAAHPAWRTQGARAHLERRADGLGVPPRGLRRSTGEFPVLMAVAAGVLNQPASRRGPELQLIEGLSVEHQGSRA